MRARDRRRRRRRDVNDQGTAGQARRVGGDGRGEDPPGRVERRPTTTGATRTPTRSTRPAPASPSCCRRRSSTRTSTKIGLIRVDLAAASALIGLLEDIYEGDGHVPVRRPGARRHHRLHPVHPRAPRQAGAGGVTLALGEQEAVQVVRAGQQLGTELLIGVEPRHVLAQQRRRAGRLRRADGVPLVVPAGDRRPPRVRGAARRPRGVGRGGAPAREPQGQPDAVVDRALRPAQDDPRRRDDRVHPRRRSPTMLQRGEGRPDARHVRRRELDADTEPPGHLQAGRDRTTGRPTGGIPRPRRRTGRRQLRREVEDQLRRGRSAVRSSVRPGDC